MDKPAGHNPLNRHGVGQSHADNPGKLPCQVRLLQLLQERLFQVPPQPENAQMGDWDRLMPRALLMIFAQQMTTLPLVVRAWRALLARPHARL